MSAQREMQRVTDDSGRQLVVTCPGCGEPVGFWLCILPPGEYQRMHPGTDLTASLLPPSERAAAMKRSAEMETKSAALGWVSCTLCGYDDQYVYGASA